MRCHRFIAWAAGLAVVACGSVAPVCQAQQAQRPVGIVSISPLDRLLQDTTYLLRAVNAPEVGGLVSLMANQYTQGFDRSLPLGVSVSLDGQMPSATIFLPVSNREQFFGALAGMGIEPDDLGDGLFEIDASGQTIFAKQVGNWLYVAQMEQALANVPADPAQQLGALPQQYNLAISLDVQAVPPELRQVPIDAMRTGLERGMAEQRGLSPEEMKRAQELSQANIEQLEQLITDTDKIIVGWNVDSTQQRVYIDIAAQFIAGSKLANSMAAMQNLKTDYGQFAFPDAAIRFNVTSKITEEEKATQILNLRNSFAQLEQVVPAADKELAKELSAGLLKVMEQTIQEGTFDGGGSVSLADDTLRALVGGRVADGKALEAELKKVAQGVAGKPRAPSFQFDIGQYKGMNLHAVTVPVDTANPNARKLLGENMKVAVATGEKSFMISIDPAGDAALKQAIDRAQAAPAQNATPMTANVEATQLLKFVQSITPNPMLDNALQVIQQYAEKDNVNITARILDRGAMYRISVDEGVLRAAGAAAKGGNRNGGF